MRSHVVALQGGLDRSTITLGAPEGTLRHCVNFFPSVFGGYKRTKGYTRYDGTGLPEDITMSVISFTNGSHPTDETSMVLNTNQVAYISTTSGTWNGGDAAGVLYSYGTWAGATSGSQTAGSGSTLTLSNDLSTVSGNEQYYLDASGNTGWASVKEYFRGTISEVTGEGPIRGVHVYRNDLYAVRNIVGSASATLWKATTSGWTSVATGLPANGKWEFTNYNFYGDPDSLSMYGCNGQGNPIKFNVDQAKTGGTGLTSIVPILTPTYYPTHLTAHRNRLWFGYEEGSVLYSSVTDETDFTTASGGSGELGMGAPVVGLKHIIDDNLVIFLSNKIRIAYGDPTDVTTFEIRTHTEEVGTVEWSVLSREVPMFVSDQGIVTLRNNQDYGNFSSDTQSFKVFETIKNKLENVVGAGIDPDSSLYRLFFDDMTSVECLVQNQQVTAITTSKYETQFNCITQGNVFSDISETVIAGGQDNGYVYILNHDNSMDGVNIVAYLATNPSSLQTPQTRKRFFKKQIDLQGEDSITLYSVSSYDYGDRITKLIEGTASSTGSLWNEVDWDEYNWDGPLMEGLFLYTNGSGVSVSEVLYTDHINKRPYTVESIEYQFDYRKKLR